MSKSDRTAPALIAAAAVLVAFWWLQHFVTDFVLTHPSFVPGAPSSSSLQQLGTLSFPLWSVAILATAGAAIVLARVAWWSRSTVVGVIYLVVGASLTLLPWLGASLAPERFDLRPWVDIMPTSVSMAVGFVNAAMFGWLDAFVMIGAVMAIVGVSVLVRSLRDRAVVTRIEGDISHRAPNILDRAGWPRLALGAAAVSLLAMCWIDPPLQGVNDLALRDGAAFSAATWDSLIWLGSRVAVACLVLVLPVLIWRTRAAMAGAIYIVVGALFIFLPFILEVVRSGPLAIGFTVQAPTSSEPLTVTLQGSWWATIGPISATQMIGAVMVIAGAAVVTRSLSDWVAAGETSGPPEATSRSAAV